jgi:ketosteroid isomerase-like protein
MKMKLARLLLIVTAACASKSAPVPPQALPAPEAVRAFMQRVFTAYEHADPNAFDSSVVDPDGYFVATAPNEVWDAASFLDSHKKMLAQVKPGSWHLQSSDLRVVAAPDGKSAYFSVLVDWDFGNGNVLKGLRWTGVFANANAAWKMSASHVSIGVDVDPNTVIAGGSAQPHDIADKVDPDAKDLLAELDADFASPERWTKDLSDSADAFAFGNEPSGIWSGGAMIRAKLVQSLASFHVQLARHGGARAHLVGQIGWIMTNVEARFVAEPGKQITLPMRVLAVYMREAGGWKMVQVHFSTAVSSSQN